MHSKRSSSNNLHQRENANRDHQGKTKKRSWQPSSLHRHKADLCALFRCYSLLFPCAKPRIPMERDYDLFERSQYNSPVWRGSVHGLENARRKLRELAKRTTNECFAIYSPTRQKGCSGRRSSTVCWHRL